MKYRIFQYPARKPKMFVVESKEGTEPWQQHTDHYLYIGAHWAMKRLARQNARAPKAGVVAEYDPNEKTLQRNRKPKLQ